MTEFAKIAASEVGYVFVRGDGSLIFDGRPKRSHGDRFRKRAVNRLTVARKTLRKWERRQRMAEKLARKWTLRVAQWEKKAQFTDEQVETLRERAARAAHIQKVRRRLLKAAGEEQTA